MSFNYNQALGSWVTITTVYNTILGCGPQLPCYGLFVDWKLFDFLLNLFEYVEGPELQLKPFPTTAIKKVEINIQTIYRCNLTPAEADGRIAKISRNGVAVTLLL